MTERPVLIVGAGPTGLALALWLTEFGVPVRIIDRTAGPGTTSRALAVQARTLEFYDQLGLADALITGGVRVANLNFWVRGRRAARVPLRRIGEGLSPYRFALVFPQDAHEQLLIDQLAVLGVAVERQTELRRFEQDADGVRAMLVRDGAEEACEATWLAGCDGASSTVRKALGIEFPGGTYTGLFYVADVEAAGPAVDGELHVDLEDADFLLLFPLREAGRVRLVGVARTLPEGEHGTLTFDDVSGRAIARLGLEVRTVHWFSTYRVHHRVAGRFRAGRAFLLGDAAHVHSPVGGQGMNTGIGDAVNLAWKLAAVRAGAAESLLDTYEPERIAFARRLVATTDRAFTLVSAPGRSARIVRTRLVPRLLPWLFRLPAWRRLAFRTLSQTGVDYRHSALSAGTAGRVQGGDRLPWVEIAPEQDNREQNNNREQDNFAPLRSRQWQAHVYGEARAGVRETCAELGLRLHRFAWGADMRRAGLARGALYLIRPDGYVALADANADPARLREYFAARGGLRGGPVQRAAAAEP